MQPPPKTMCGSNCTNVLRPGQAPEVECLREIERSAGRAFAQIGMEAVASDEPLEAEILARASDEGRVWVAVDETNQPVAYLLVSTVDGNTHIEQVSVHADHAGQRIGRALVEAAVALAKEKGDAMVTLTTFAEVPWNAPYYERMGFEVFTPRLPELKRIRRHEAASGLDRWPRVCMRLLIEGAS